MAAAASEARKATTPATSSGTSALIVIPSSPSGRASDTLQRRLAGHVGEEVGAPQGTSAPSARSRTIVRWPAALRAATIALPMAPAPPVTSAARSEGTDAPYVLDDR